MAITFVKKLCVGIGTRCEDEWNRAFQLFSMGMVYLNANQM